MSKVPVALQLYAVRGEVEKNLGATLEAVARIGYVGAEPWGYRGDVVGWNGMDAKALRAAYDAAGLRCCGMHIATEALQGDNLARTIELNQALGNRFVIIAMDKARMSAVGTIAELAQILEDAAERLAGVGMFTGYHAHGFDFADVEGKPAWYRLFEQVSDRIVMQLDVGNCASGGGDPIDVLRRFPGKARSVHLKDYGKPGAVIGEGNADWPEIFRLCETEHHTEWYVVEEGGENGFGFDVCTRSFEAMRGFGKV